MSQMSQNVTDVTHVTAVTGNCHGHVTDVTANFPQALENKGSGPEMSQPGCHPLYNKQMRIGKGAPERARGSAPCGQGRVHVRRVLWRRDKVVVYQDTRGRYWWADLEGKKKRSALIGGQYA